MKKLAWGAVALFAIAAAACGGSKDKPMLPQPDSGSTVCDPLAQTGCGQDEKCAWIEDVAPTDTTNAVGHIGCVPNGTKAIGESCTTNGVDAMGKPDGTGFSDCVKGSECIAGFCRAICNPDPTLNPMCDSNHSCGTYASLFELNDQTIAGICDVRCDPLTQAAAAGTNRAACGTADPTKPRFGCYGRGDDFTCAPNSLPGKCTSATTPATCTKDSDCAAVPGTSATPRCNPDGVCVVRCNYSYNDDFEGDGMPDNCPSGQTCEFDAIRLRTDRVPAATPGPMTAYRNGCAPGFIPFFFEMTGSTTVVCGGLCSPMKTDNTLQNNVIGNPATPAKLPLEAAPAAGNAVCVTGKKGSVGTNPPNGRENCLHMWLFNIDMQGMLADIPENDNLGICMDFTKYTYDDDNNAQTPRVPRPSCLELPPRGNIPNCTCNAMGLNCAGSGCPHGQAHEWSCYNTRDAGIFTFGSTGGQIKVPDMKTWYKEFRVGELEPGQAVRHRIVQPL